MDESTGIVLEMCGGEFRHVDRLFDLAYDDLRGLAHAYVKQSTDKHLVQPTELLHELYVKLIDRSRVDWRGRSHFMRVGASAMRNILVDLARQKGARKRGGGQRRVPLNEAVTITLVSLEDVLAVDEALARLADFNETQAKLVESRFFAGMTVAEAAEALGMSKRTAEQQWTFAKAWLRRELSKGVENDG